LVAEHVQRVEDRDVVKLHAEMVSRRAKSLSEENDKDVVRERLQRVHSLLGDAGIAQPSVKGVSGDENVSHVS
jgi:hypothetical protein